MKVRVEKNPDGTYIAYNVDGESICLIGSGDSVNDAKTDFCNSVKETTEAFMEKNVNLPHYLYSDVDFYFDLSSLFEYPY